MSLSNNYFCAINNIQELSCYRLTHSTATLETLNIPKNLIQEKAIDVSVGPKQICAVSAKSATTCWTYSGHYYNSLVYVPHRLRQPGSTLSVHAGTNKHCAIDLDSTLTC